MSTDETNPFLISAPPGVPAPKPRRSETEVPLDPDDFITLPPGIVDSGTLRLATRSPRPTEPPGNDIVFFPAAPGSPVPPPEDDPEATRIGAARHSVPAWTLTLPTGETVEVAGAVFIGRDPARTAEWPDAELLPVVDPAKSLSKTHALIQVDAGHLWVHDLNSTNGIFVAEPGREVVEVKPGSRMLVPAGAELELGEYVLRVRRS